MKKIADDKKVFRKSLIIGLIILVIGWIINMISTANASLGVNFAGAWIAGLGLLIIIFAVIYAVTKVLIQSLSKSKKISK